VGLGGFGSGILGGEGVLTGSETGLQRIVAVDDRVVHVGQRAGQLGGFQFLDLDVVRVLGDVVDGGRQTGAVPDGDDALGGQQLQGAGLVGGVVGHGDDRAVGDLIQAAALAGVDAEGFI